MYIVEPIFIDGGKEIQEEDERDIQENKENYYKEEDDNFKVEFSNKTE